MPLQHITVYQMLSIKVDYTMFSSARLSNFGSAASVLRISYFPNLPQHSVTLEKLLMMKLHVVTSSILLAIISALAGNFQSLFESEKYNLLRLNFCSEWTKVWRRFGRRQWRVSALTVFCWQSRPVHLAGPCLCCQQDPSNIN